MSFASVSSLLPPSTFASDVALFNKETNVQKV